jgi:hypothetical protein
VFIGLPLIALGLLWWFGRPSPRRRAAQLLLLFPLLVLIGAGAEVGLAGHPAALSPPSSLESPVRGSASTRVATPVP